MTEGTANATITVTRTGGSAGIVGATVSTSPGTALAGSDYTTTVQAVSFGNLDTANKTVSIPIINDSIFENSETLTLTLSSPTGGATLGSQSTAILTIIDNDVANVAPTVNAGADQSVGYPVTVSLVGAASDDGLPSATLTTTWSKLSGPGTVTFGNAASLSTTASFSVAGAYVLRLTAFDGDLTSTDDMSVTLSTAPTAPTVVMVVATCRFTLSGTPPDGTGGWAAQFFRSATKINNQPDTTAPYSVTTTLNAGVYDFSIQWTKTGSATQTSQHTSGNCQ